jgi:F-type H+-transporting ATPase subunit epsilon
MAGTFRLSVVTPEREVVAVEARFVALPAYDGELGVLSRRSALLTQLGSGLLRIEATDGSKRELFVSGGFAQMVDDKLTLLTEEATDPATIDAHEAENAAAVVAQLPSATSVEAERKYRAAQRARALARAARRNS